jgi:hypothetical protein
MVTVRYQALAQREREPLWYQEREQTQRSAVAIRERARFRNQYLRDDAALLDEVQLLRRRRGLG